MFIPSLKLRHSFRYAAGAAGAGSFATPQNINSDDLLNAYIVALTATTSSRVIYALKIRRIRMWGPPAALGSAGTAIGLDLQGGSTTNGFAPSLSFSDTAMGVAPAYIDVHPSDEYIAGWWMTNALTNVKLLEVYGPTGTIIQFDVDVVLVDSESVTNGPALTGATAGNIYSAAIGGATALTPVGLSQAP